MLIVFEMANNHAGEVDLGRRIIDEFRAVADKFPQFRYAFKSQYRNLPTFIHPSADPNHKYVKRFRETDLSLNDRLRLKYYAEERRFITACTPFDEESVDDMVRHGYDILKIGSPSITDLQLLYKIKTTWNRPIIASVGGAPEEGIDYVVELFKGQGLTLMHCVSEYPTKPENAQLNQIDWLRNRYPGIPVGFSSHQPPGTNFTVDGNVDVFEFHVCIDPRPNQYSLNPGEAKTVLKGVVLLQTINGVKNTRVPGPVPSQFMRRFIDGRMWWMPEDVVEEVMALVKKSGVVVPKGATMELSHHFGINRFRESGAAVITCFNREYSKKILAMLPKQVHPKHHHIKKEETFMVLYGSVDINNQIYTVGETLIMERGTPHFFIAQSGGVVFEEVSTTHYPDDSFYEYDKITFNTTDRKTKVREF